MQSSCAGQYSVDGRTVILCFVVRLERQIEIQFAECYCILYCNPYGDIRFWVLGILIVPLPLALHTESHCTSLVRTSESKPKARSYHPMFLCQDVGFHASFRSFRFYLYSNSRDLENSIY
jgi:hypothetical protein